MELSDQPEAPAALPRCPLMTRLSGPEQGWIVLKRQKSLAPTRTRNPNRLHSPTTLSHDRQWYPTYQLLWHSKTLYLPTQHTMQPTAGLSLRRPVFEHRPVHRDLWRTVAFGQVLLRTPRFRDLRSFGILRRVEWYFRTDVSRQCISPIFRGQAVQAHTQTT
jgi:hypothetical protein